jgi:hypothetical protein
VVLGQALEFAVSPRKRPRVTDMRELHAAGPNTAEGERGADTEARADPEAERHDRVIGRGHDGLQVELG